MKKKFLLYKKQIIIILAISLSLGIILLCFGFYTRNHYLKDLESRKESINNQLVLYESNKNEEYLKNGLTEEYHHLNQKIETLRDQFVDVNEKLIKNKTNFLTGDSLIYFSMGLGFVLLSLIGSIIILYFKKSTFIEDEGYCGITDEDILEIELDINGEIEELTLEE